MPDDGPDQKKRRKGAAKDRHLKLRQLEVYVEAAKRKSFLDAAKHLGLSTAYVSEVIAALEEELGNVVLFDRDTGASRLTREGRLLFGTATEMLRLEQNTRKAMAGLTRKDEVVLHVACHTSLAVYARAAVGRLLGEHPHVRVQAFEGSSEEVRSRVASNKADVGLDYVPDAPLEEFDSLVTDKTRLVFVATKVHGLRNEEKVRLQQLSHEPFALPWIRTDEPHAPNRTRDTITSYFAEHHFTPSRVVFEGSTVESVLAIVRAENAVAVLQSLDVPDRTDLVVRPLSPVPREHAVVFIRRRGAERSEEIHALEGAVISALSSAGNIR